MTEIAAVVTLHLAYSGGGSCIAVSTTTGAICPPRVLSWFWAALGPSVAHVVATRAILPSAALGPASVALLFTDIGLLGGEPPFTLLGQHIVERTLGKCSL